MNRQEHLLTILAEECVEVAHAVTKSLRFGLDDQFKGNPINKDHLSQELGDLLGIYFKLIREGIIDPPAESLITAKDAKIEKYLSYSKLRKTLTE